VTRLSIRARLVAAYAIVLAGVLGTTFGLLQWRLRVGVRGVLDEDIGDDARAMAGFVDRGDTAGFIAAEATMRAARGENPASDLVVLRDARGVVIGGAKEAEPAFDAAAAAALAPGALDFRNVRIPGRHGRFRVVTLAREPRPGERRYVQVFRSLGYTDRMLERFAQGFIAAAVLGSVLAAAGGLLLLRVAFRPFAALVADARAISPEDLERRLRDPGTGDELARLTAVLNGLLDRVSEGVASVRRFVHDASHEIRTPLASLRLGSEALLRGDLPEGPRDLIVGNLEEIERLSRLLDDLLALARAEGEPARRPAAPLDAAELVEFVAERVRPLAEAGEVALEVAAGAPGAATVSGDRDALVRLFWNLFENAIKYTPPGGRVRVACEAGRGAARIRVEDTGRGIASEDLPRVFERFYRGAGARGGTGLGLAIARAIARRHGGDVAIESAPGRGTAATVTLPASGERAPPPASPPA
jgi:two-component system OmpR family sensor kinase